ncbi:MAG: DNRLRE domain-containing protein, partial [Actinomycetota bacterium]|nr:DNRLRE domain-containing protein [Actinomycetota bacterium]
MKRVQRRFGRIISCVLTFVLLSGQAAGISSAYASVPDDSRVPEVQTSPYSSSETSPTVVRELVEERSEAGRQFLLSDGTIRAEYFGEPIHYRDKRSGAMERIETTLAEASADGRSVSVNRANRFRLQLPGDLQEDQVSVAIGEAMVALRPAWRNRPGAADPGAGKLPATAESPTERSYPRAFTDATLKFESRADGVKETIVVPEHSDANVYGFDLELTGLTPRLEVDGSISLRAPGEATPTLTMPAPCMWDSAESTIGPAFSDSVHYELSGAGSVWRLDVVIDSAWLDDPQRAYPVYVDPTLYTSATPLDTYVSSNSPSTNYSGSNRIWVNTGNPAAYWWEYGYIQFPTSLVSDLATKKASGYGAIFGVMSLFHDSTAVLGTVSATRVTSTTNISTVTWATRPTGTASIAGCYPAYIEPNDWNGWDITDAVKIWQQNATSSCTVAISASAGAHLAFKSVQLNQQVPLLEVYYAPTPTVSRTSPTSGSTTTLPNAAWTYSSPDAQTNWELEVREGSTTGPLVGTKSGTGTGTSTTPPTPTGGWKVGTAYYVRMRAASTATINSIKMWSAWTSWGSFTPALPTAPSVVRTSPTSGDVTVLPAATWTYSSAYAQTNWELEVREGSTGGPVVGTASGTGTSTRDSVLPTPSGGWLVGTTYYVRIRAAHSATCSFGSPPFWSAWTTYGSFRPTLPPPPTVVLSSPTSGDVSTLPTATWTFTCADLQTDWQLEVATTPSGTPVAAASGSGTATSTALPTPSGGWQAGTTYHVRVRAASSPAGAFSTPVWSAWTLPGSLVPAPPSPVGTAATETTASAEWFLEEDADGNGIGDAPNDSADAGRGSVALSWSPTAGAVGYRVYLFDGNVYRQVASTTALSWSSAGAGIFPSDSAIAALSDGTTGDPFPAGTGLDLRDDPRSLYAKTAGSTMDGVSAYEFKVVPYGTFGEGSVDQAAGVLTALESRTVAVNRTVQHSEATIGEYAEHRVEAVLDASSMRAETTDLVIASYGPPARLSRACDSSRPDEGLFGPGWRFNFEQAIEATSGQATFTDENGDAHRFYLRDGVYHAPSGYDAELTREFLPPGVELGYRLSFRGGNSMLFDESGTLCEERDSNDTAVYYDRSVANQLSIWAANGLRIIVDFDAGSVSVATYTTTDGTRQVVYSTTTNPQYGVATNTCTYYPDTDDERTIRYDYGITFVPGIYYLTDLAVVEEPSANWHFEASPRPDNWYQNEVQVGHLEWGVDHSATVVHVGLVYPENYDEMLRTETYTEYEWNPTGTLGRRSSPYAFDDPVRWRTFAYSADGDIARETDPLGNSRTWDYDARGNVIAETDEEGGRTTYAHGTSGGELDRVTEETSPSGSTTYRTYDERGNVLAEETVLNAAGERARTAWSYDEQGRTLREERAISDEESATTTFSSFAPCGEPGTVSHPGVVLSSGAAPVTLSEHTSYDAFGNVTSRTDATGVVTETNAYTDAGRLTESVDASGTAQASTYDALGRVTESWREAGGQVAERVAYVYDALGNLEREDHYDGATVAFTVTHTTDALGRTLSSDHSISGKTTRWYDAAGNVAVEWVPGVDQPSDDFGAEAEIVKKAARTRYDAAGRAVAVVAPGNPDDKADTTTYSASGRVIRSEAADGSWTAYVYDGGGNRISETRPTENGGAAATDTYSYDLAGRLV